MRRKKAKYYFEISKFYRRGDFRLNVPHDATVSADMTSKGIFVVHAVSSGGVVHKQMLLFEGGVVDCLIFFEKKKYFLKLFLKMFICFKNIPNFAKVFLSDYKNII